MENQRIGLAGRYINLGEPLVMTPGKTMSIVTSTDDPYTSYIMWLIVGLCAAIALVMFGIIIYKYCRKDKK
jgi:hypothetical protein